MKSIEWLENELRKNENIRWRGANIEDIFEQAKEMHKQEIIDTWEKADTFPQGYYNAEHYYNETFKKD